MSIDKSITHIRPRFKFTVPFSQEVVMSRIVDLLAKAQGEVKGQIVQNHITLDLPEHSRHYWSPQLNFRVEVDEEDKGSTTIKGLIGPRPNVWTMFMFIYFAVGAAGFVLSIYGVSKWMLGEENLWIYALPMAGLIMLTAYWTGKYGEKLGQNQIEYLKQFVRDALEMVGESPN